MAKPAILYFVLSLFMTCFKLGHVNAQVNPSAQDTFFLAKQKGLLGRLGRSLAVSPQDEPEKIAYPYLKYVGRTIRSVEVIPFGMNQKLVDTTAIKITFVTKIGDALHKNTRAAVIKKNLFFKEGDKFLPLLVSDNERFLRDQNFLGDALIVVLDAPYNSVDIVVLTRDVFSIGGNLNANPSRFRTQVREENLAGTGHQLAISAIYEKVRTPKTGVGAELILKNIKGSFLNWYSGFTTLAKSFGDRFEQTTYYTRLEKPLVNRYSQWTGAFEVSYNTTTNAYALETYRSEVQYNYRNLDLWGGYNIGYKTKKGRESETRLRHFVAARTFYTYFGKIPASSDTLYNRGAYANINGVLFSYNLYKQNYYRTSFIYGFGRTEDVPIGLSASLITGWTNKQDQRRPYYGIEFEGNRFSSKKIFSSYKARAGGYYSNGKLQDIDLLASIDHFTRLRQISRKWFNRNFISFSYTRQLNMVLNQSLYLRSEFGLLYSRDAIDSADQRTTVKLESVFYNLDKLLGFRFAPFVFADISLLKPINQPGNKTDGFSAVGGGIRTRNESLVFGTIELKGYFFPRTLEGTKNWKVDINTKLRFRFNSNFIRKPDFIVAN